MEISGKESIDSDIVSFSGYLRKKSPSGNVPGGGSVSRKLIPTLVSKDRYFDHPGVLIACVYPIILDSLFLYIPIINEDTKCLMLDQNLMKSALVIRFIIDVMIIAFIPIAIRTWRAETERDESDDKEIWAGIVMNNLIPIIAAVLPIPQITIVVLLPKMRGLRSFNRMKIMNALIVLQYVVRGYPFYRFCKNQNKKRVDKNNKSKSYWILGATNFVMYIIACHVFGAFWYFYSIQREIDCWTHSCRNEKGCEFSTLDCNDHQTFRNITLINDSCPINPSNETVFNFGIFLDALQSGMLGSTNFPRKVLQCFSWGLRNLSSFGSNLKTSSCAWENLFVALVSISGLLLFIYLLGHLETFMQTTNRSVWLRRKTRPQIKAMLSEYDLPFVLEKVIWRMVRDRLRGDHDNIFSLLPENLKRDIKLHLFLPTLKNVTMLETMDKELLKEICAHLEPMKFTGINYIIREGEPLDMMFFVMQGFVLTYTTNNGGTNGSLSSTCRLEKGDYYGAERLLNWAAASTSFSDIPISPRTVKSHKRVEVFAITANELQLLVSKFSRMELSDVLTG